MRTYRAAAGRSHCRGCTIILLAVIAVLLPHRGFSQAERATSRIKKPLIYQIGNIVHINADGSRPLLRALDALQEKYGWIVDYEDPRYLPDAEPAADVQSAPKRRHANGRNSRGESFSVAFDAGPPDGRPDENSVLTAVVNAYNESSVDAQFELRNEKEQDERFEVVGVGVRGPSDEASTQQPILDLRISLPTELRSTAQTMVLICQKVSERSGVSVTTTIADSWRGKGSVKVGGIDVLTRTLLSRTVASAGDRPSWRLFYDSRGKRYELSVNGLSQ